MTFQDYKGYRAVYRPVWELKKWRQAQANKPKNNSDILTLILLLIGLGLMIAGICAYFPQVWL